MCNLFYSFISYVISKVLYIFSKLILSAPSWSRGIFIKSKIKTVNVNLLKNNKYLLLNLKKYDKYETRKDTKIKYFLHSSKKSEKCMLISSFLPKYIK